MLGEVLKFGILFCTGVVGITRKFEIGKFVKKSLERKGRSEQALKNVS